MTTPFVLCCHSALAMRFGPCCFGLNACLRYSLFAAEQASTAVPQLQHRQAGCMQEGKADNN